MPFVVSMRIEDRGRTLEEIQSLYFNTLYCRIVVFVYPLVISYHNFLVLCALN
jgi:hypothetical protein